MKFSSTALLLFLLFFSCKSQVNSDSSILQENSNSLAVVDSSNIFSISENYDLANKLVQYAEKTTRQIVVVTVDSIFPYDDIRKYAGDLRNYWGIGQKDVDNGLVLVLSTSLKKVAISTGYGTKKILTDSICKKVIDSVMVPAFKKGNYYIGVDNGVDSLIEIWNTKKTFD
jgi:uncharacterized protein